MTTSTLDRHAVHAAEVFAAAVGFQYGLARLLAHAVESATRADDRQLVPAPRRGDRPEI